MLGQKESKEKNPTPANSAKKDRVIKFMDKPQEQLQAQQPTNPTPSQVNSSRKSIVIPIGLGILFVLVAIVAYLLGTRQSQKVIQNQLTPVAPTSIPSPTPDETTNWKTYADGYYSFKYPSNWSATGVYEDYYKYQIVTLYNPNQSVVLEVFPTQPPYGWGGVREWETNNLEIDFEDKKYTVVENFVDDGAYVDFKIVKDKEYHILFGTGHPTTSKSKSVADYKASRNTILRILSTFKFTSP